MSFFYFFKISKFVSVGFLQLLGFLYVKTLMIFQYKSCKTRKAIITF